MGKVQFDIGIDSVRGILMGTDPYYIRQYRGKDGSVKHIIQARPDRSGHKATKAEAANRKAFGLKYGTGRKGEKNKEQRPLRSKNKDRITEKIEK